MGVYFCSLRWYIIFREVEEARSDVKFFRFDGDVISGQYDKGRWGDCEEKCRKFFVAVSNKDLNLFDDLSSICL